MDKTIPIPCKHLLTVPGCPVCALAEKDIRYARLFNRQFEPRTPQEKEKLQKWRRVLRPCPYLGTILREKIGCGCPKVFFCSIKGRVTKIGTHPDEPDLPQCFQCEYHPDA